MGERAVIPGPQARVDDKGRERETHLVESYCVDTAFLSWWNCCCWVDLDGTKYLKGGISNVGINILIESREQQIYASIPVSKGSSGRPTWIVDGIGSTCVAIDVDETEREIAGKGSCQTSGQYSAFAEKM